MSDRAALLIGSSPYSKSAVLKILRTMPRILPGSSACSALPTTTVSDGTKAEMETVLDIFKKQLEEEATGSVCGFLEIIGDAGSEEPVEEWSNETATR